MNFENAVLNIQTDTTVNISLRIATDFSEIKKIDSIIDQAQSEIRIIGKSVGASDAYLSRDRHSVWVTIGFKGGRSDELINQTVAQVAVILGRLDGRAETTSAAPAEKPKKPQAAKVQKEAKVEEAPAPIIVPAPAPAPAPAKKKRVVKHPTDGMNPRQIAAWKKKMSERLIAARAVKAINDAKRKAEIEFKGKKN
jgi:hypothetical protein